MYIIGVLTVISFIYLLFFSENDNNEKIEKIEKVEENEELNVKEVSRSTSYEDVKHKIVELYDNSIEEIDNMYNETLDMINNFELKYETEDSLIERG